MILRRLSTPHPDIHLWRFVCRFHPSPGSQHRACIFVCVCARSSRWWRSSWWWGFAACRRCFVACRWCLPASGWRRLLDDSCSWRGHRRPWCGTLWAHVKGWLLGHLTGWRLVACRCAFDLLVLHRLCWHLACLYFWFCWWPGRIFYFLGAASPWVRALLCGTIVFCRANRIVFLVFVR